MKFIESEIYFHDITINDYLRESKKAVQAKRQQALTEAFTRHPNRFKGKHPEPPKLPEAAWINPPQPIKQGGIIAQTIKRNLH